MFASVIVSVSSKEVNRIFEYRIPDGLADMIKIGHRVLVPFGPRNIQGYVVNIKDTVEFDASKIKPINRTLDIEPVLTHELITLAKHLADYYIDPYISVIETILPAALKSQSEKVLKLSDQASSAAVQFFESNHFDGKVPTKTLNIDLLETVKPFIANGDIIEEIEIKQHTNKKYAKALKPTFQPGRNFGRAVKQLELLDHLENHEYIELKTLHEDGYSAHTINELVKKGYAEKINVVIERDPFERHLFEFDAPKVLNEDQAYALNRIKDSMEHKESKTFLLHGITGSGKTEVYLQAIKEVLDNGQEAIMLVPEIALTPQMVNRFKSRFGDEVAVLHSGLSHGEKYDEWRKIKEGRARVSVGARSSIFAPFENVGIIIVDEEHETTYKQTDRPMYHAVEVAKYRSGYHKCPIVLGTATPSLETYARSEKGVYERLELQMRAATNILPETKIVDMAEEHRQGNTSVISEPLKAAIEKRIEKGEQTVLLLNRRGYANFQICQSCGHVPNCPNCDISLTYHKKNNSLLCHYCGYEDRVKRECADCGSDDVTFRGTGTEKIEEILRDLFKVEVVRMDNDTTRRKGMHETLLNRFEKEEIPILLGTQMIAKGLDYPKVTLVGVLNADTMLNLPDFRANEKTFQLLTQVAGRAGRHELSGEVIFQTYSSTHYAVTLSQSNDYHAFYEKEMAFRKFAGYSPFYFHVLFTVSAEDIKKCLEAAAHIHDTLTENVSETAVIVGPSPSPIERINNQHRFQILLKYKREPALGEVLHELDRHYYARYKKESLSLRVDVDPQYIM